MKNKPEKCLDHNFEISYGYMECKNCGYSPEDDEEDQFDDDCFYCMGDRWFHDCGEDCCPCLDPDFDIPCPECNPEGRLSMY
jgi:hypothetical protein